MKNWLWVLAVLLIAYSCKKDKSYSFPLIFTGDVTNVNKDGANYNAKIVDLGSKDILEYGFVWDSVPNPTINKAEKFVVKDAPKTGVFNSTISNSLREGVKYYVRAYIKNQDYTSYGLQKVFTSLGCPGPDITGFSPKTGNIKDTVMILGHNFSSKFSGNIVRFSGYQATVFKGSQDTIWVTVPKLLNISASTISVTSINKEGLSTEKFNLIPPVINDFNAKTGSIGSQVTISGNSFSANSLSVCFDKYFAKIISVNKTNIVVTVPDSLDKRLSNIKVIMNNLSVISTAQFQVNSVTTSDFTPKIAITGSTIILNGNNFSPIAANNKVTFGGFTATVTKASLNRLEVTLPLQNTGYYDSRNVKVNVSVSGVNMDYTDLFTINDRFFRLHDLNFLPGYNWCGVVSVQNGKAYYNADSRNDFWAYDPANDKWTRLADFPNVPRAGATGFSRDDKIFYGTGDYPTAYNDWWEYTISSNTWKRKNDFIGSANGVGVTFQIDNDNYFAMGNYFDTNNFWKYSTTTDTWTRVGSLPINYWHWNFTFAYTNNGVAYAGVSSDVSYVWGTKDNGLFKFNPANNSWQKLIDFMPEINSANSLSFMVKGVLYIRSWTSATNFDFYSYNDSNNSWVRMHTDFPLSTPNAMAFSIGEKEYIMESRVRDFWEFDPSR